MRVETMYDEEGNEVKVVRGNVKDFSSPTFTEDLCAALDEARGEGSFMDMLMDELAKVEAGEVPPVPRNIFGSGGCVRGPRGRGGKG